MSEAHVDFIRGKTVESTHEVKALVTNVNGRILLSTNNDDDFFFPRSSIKVFQAIPFAMSDAIKKYKLNNAQIALACASHKGEKYHLNELKKWILKTNLKTKNLQCGIHEPLDKKAHKKIIYSRKKCNELYNNCAGKHLAMLTSCLVNNHGTLNYLDFNDLPVDEIQAKLNINNNLPLKESLKKYGRSRETFRKGKKDEWKKYFNEEIYTFFEKNIPDSIDKITYEKLNKFK